MFDERLDERWGEFVESRASVRKYDAAPDDEQYQRLVKFSHAISGQGVRIEVIKGSGMTGPIKNTDVYAAIIALPDTPPELEGWLGQQFVLECSRMGLASCWLGGNFNKPIVRKRASMLDKEHVNCVICVGKLAKHVRGRERKSVHKLTGIDRERFAELPEWQQKAVLFARRAPSAMNFQPWFFAVEEGRITVEDRGKNFGYGKIDRGIAMLNLTLGAQLCGVTGRWEQGKNKWSFISD